jgi:hypothetical protein
MPFVSPASQPVNEAEALTKAKKCDALRENLRKIAGDFVAAPTEGAGVVDRRNLCGRYYTLAAAAAACGLRRASSDLPRFAWTDAFTGHEQPPNSSWGYELACALFNLAASLADLANGKPHWPLCEDAFKLYQQAAFTLDKLAEVSQQEGPWHGCEDLSGDTVSILSCLMLAQAQKALYLEPNEARLVRPPTAGAGEVPAVAAECEVPASAERMRGARHKRLRGTLRPKLSIPCEDTNQRAFARQRVARQRHQASCAPKKATVVTATKSASARTKSHTMAYKV